MPLNKIILRNYSLIARLILGKYMSRKAGFDPIRRHSIEEEVYIRIREAILKGDIKGGERLVHEKLAERLGTSRIPVRDALKRLNYDGLVDINKRGVCYACRFGLEDIEEIYSLRKILETHAVFMACSRLSEVELGELEHLQYGIEQAIEAGDRQVYVRLNKEFHYKLYESSGQPRLLRMIHNLWQGLPPLTPITSDKSLVSKAKEHRRVLDALRRRDAEAAAAAICEHIAVAGSALYEQIARNEEKSPDYPYV